MATGQTTLGAVRTQAKYRADMVRSEFVTNAEWLTYINDSYRELYGLLLQKYGNDYFVAGTPDNWYQFTTSGSTASYVLPDGSSTYKLLDGTTTAPAFLKLLGVDVKHGSDWHALLPFNFVDRNQRQNGQASNLNRPRYRITGARLWFAPTPQGSLTVRIFYIPRLTELSADDDVLDGVNGWEEYVIIDAAIKAMQKEESDVSVLFAQKGAIIKRLDAEAENRDAGSPATVSETRRDGAWADDGDGDGLGWT